MRIARARDAKHPFGFGEAAQLVVSNCQIECEIAIERCQPMRLFERSHRFGGWGRRRPALLGFETQREQGAAEIEKDHGIFAFEPESLSRKEDSGRGLLVFQSNPRPQGKILTREKARRLHQQHNGKQSRYNSRRKTRNRPRVSRTDFQARTGHNSKREGEEHGIRGNVKIEIND